MKLTPEKLNELIENSTFLNKWSLLRLGQSSMIALYDIDKQLYTEITGTEFDPFYNDSKIDNFFKYITDL